jgi:hypothetical protein
MVLPGLVYGLSLPSHECRSFAGSSAATSAFPGCFVLNSEYASPEHYRRPMTYRLHLLSQVP